MKIAKIVTGGQSGADLAGNFFAKKNGIETEINTFKDFKPVNGKLPDDVKVNYVCDKHNYNENLKCRTLYNVKNSDLTIILLDRPIEHTKGSRLTLNNCIRLKKPCICVNILSVTGTYNSSFKPNRFSEIKTIREIEDILTFEGPRVINIAGPRNLNERDAIEFLEKLLC